MLNFTNYYGDEQIYTLKNTIKIILHSSLINYTVKKDSFNGLLHRGWSGYISELKESKKKHTHTHTHKKREQYKNNKRKKEMERVSEKGRKERKQWDTINWLLYFNKISWEHPALIVKTEIKGGEWGRESGPGYPCLSP